MSVRDAVLPFFEPVTVSSSALSPVVKKALDARLNDGQVTCVLLGEATHGSHEFFLLRHQISRYLIEQHGFQTIALEASWFRTRRLNQFLYNDRPFSDELTGRLYYWIWSTAEMADFLIWLKQYRIRTNAPVSIHGIDFLYSREVIPVLLRTLQEQGMSISQQIDDCLMSFYRQGDFPQPQVSPEAPAFQTELDALHQLEKAIRHHQQQTGKLQSVLLQSVRIIRQMLRYFASSHERIHAYLQRDFFMAENVYHLQAQSTEQRKIIVFTHNNHAATIQQQGQPLSMGAHLACRMPLRCFSLAMLFRQGSFQAIQPGQAPHERRVYAVEQPLPGSYEAHFAECNLPDGIFHLDKVSSHSPAASWWQESRPYWSIGAAFDPQQLQKSTSKNNLANSFSSAIYLNHVQASHLTIPTG